MKESESERDIEIRIIDDSIAEPDEDFYVQLLDEETRKPLKGSDTSCKVTILDEDGRDGGASAGYIGFK